MRVERARAQQLVVRANRVDAAPVNHDDAVGVAHRCEPVRDHQRGAPALQALERQRDLALALRVELAGGLVEQQHRPVGQDGAGDRDALALAAG